MSQALQSKIEMYGSFFLNGGEFALAVSDIREVVNAPTRFTSMPLAPSFLLGLFNLRGMIIPVLDPKKLLGQEDLAEEKSPRKIAIVEYGGVHIGLLFDETGQILRQRAEERSGFTYQTPRAHENVISGALKMDGGKRIVQIIDVQALVRLEKIPHSQNDFQGLESRSRHQRHQGDRHQCISFRIGAQRFALDIDAIHEIIKTPPIQSSTYTNGSHIGAFELRGDLIPAVDFAALLGCRERREKSAFTEDQRFLIVRIAGERCGLLVDGIENIITYYGEEVLSLPLLNPEKSAMFKGCLCRPDQEDLILFHPDALLSAGEMHEITQGHSKMYASSAEKNREQMRRRGQRRSYITFRLDNLFALGIDEVREIIAYPTEILQPPGRPSFIRGMFNLRGHIVSIVDTRALYGLPPAPAGSPARILIFEREGMHYGLVVDGVEHIVSFSEEEKIKIPEILYKGAGGAQGLVADVKFAVEVELSEQKRTLLILNPTPLMQRLGLAAEARPA